MRDGIAREDVERALREAIKRVCDEDGIDVVLGSNGSERTLTHRLAVHVERMALFEGWQIDCEYNRDGHDPKRLHLEEHRSDESCRCSCMLPDIVVHRRGKSGSEANLLAVEAKRSADDIPGQDRRKLEAYREQLDYQFVAFVTFEPQSVQVLPDGAELPPVDP